MRLLAVRLYRNKHRLEAFFQTEDRGRLKVPLVWMERCASDIPPETWSTTVNAEVENSKTLDTDALSALRKASRRK